MNYPFELKDKKVEAFYMDNNFNITQKESVHRVMLSIEGDSNETNKIAVLMMNPSLANKKQSDLSTNRLIALLKLNNVKYSKLFIFNISSKIQTNAINFSETNKFYSENFKYIKNKVNNNNIDNIVFATGNILDSKITGKSFIRFKKEYNRIMRSIYKYHKDCNLYAFGNLKYSDLDSKHLFFAKHPITFNLGEDKEEAKVKIEKVNNTKIGKNEKYIKYRLQHYI